MRDEIIFSGEARLSALGAAKIFAEGLQLRWGATLARIGNYGSVLISVLLLAVVLRELGQANLTAAFTELPLSLPFYLAFLIFFLGSPVIEWLILRRLWNAPFSGFWAILRKMIYNDMLISYLGDAYLFAWIRRELKHIRTPFVVVKDMAILSAFAGSVTTLAAIAVAWPLFPQVKGAGLDNALWLALALPLASGGVIAIFRNALLSLPRSEILFIASACAVRNIIQNAAAIVMWWSLMPQVPMTTWFVLVAVRMVSTRLPLVPNKDLAFAAVTVALIGSHDGIAPMIVMVTSLALLANIAVAVGLSLGSWWQVLIRRRLAAA